MKNYIDVISKNNKVMLLAYDQGFEHGPIEFDEKSVDPEYILKIAREGGYTGVVLHEGVAERYWMKERDVPLVIKLNGKTSLHPGEEPFSPQLCTVERAFELGASAVGYTIYVGSKREAEMMREFSRLEDEAHEKGMGVIAWMYPRGESVKGRENDKEIVAYAARLGLEMNADLVKIPYTGDRESMSWVVKAAGRTGVLVQGGKKVEVDDFINEMRDVMDAGAVGVAVGRNVWKSVDPNEVSEKLSKVVWP